MFARATLVFASVLIAFSASAQDGSGEPHAAVEAVVAVDLSGAEVTLSPVGPYTTSIGLPFEVTVSVRVPESCELVSVSVAGNRFIELTEHSPLVEVDGVSTQTLRLSVFRSGPFTSSGVEALVIDGNGEQHRISSAPFVVEVESRIVNENDPAPAPSDPPLTVLSRDMRPVYAGSALGFVGLGVLIAALWRRRNKVEEALDAEEIVRRPAWEIAFEALDALHAEGMLDDGRHLEFHMRLSEILREYIGARFSFLALEMTTTEIAKALSDKDTGEYRDELLEVLGDMDLVKFAKFTPPRELSDSCFDSVKRVVTELSARERQVELPTMAQPVVSPEVVEGGVQENAPTDPHAPSPTSTTASFSPGAEGSPAADDSPANVVEFRGQSSPWDAPTDRVFETPSEPEDE